MIASAHPLFENLPGTFADPLGLADQQAQGTTSLVLARYDDPPDDLDGSDAPRSCTYDAFVVASGGVVAVARSTPDYRFPVAPAAAVQRFLDARGADTPPALSLFEVSPDAASRFLESTFLAECLKVHVDGPASAPLVADQLDRCGCQRGLLEVNDFSDPAAPRVALVEVGPDQAPDLDVLLAGVRGRVLLYDRDKNAAVARDRAGAPLDCLAAVAEADRLAVARRSTAPPPASLPAPPSQADAVETALRTGHQSDADEPTPTHPHAAGLAALVAELQGAPLPSSPEPPAPPAEDAPLAEDADDSQGLAALPPDPSPPTSAPSPSADAASPPPPAAHPLARPLDALRVAVYALFEDAVGKERALAHEAHVLDDLDVPSPVPPDRTVEVLRALLTADPPKRWHFFKRGRAKAYEPVAAALLAFHGAHGHDRSPEAQAAVHDVSQLWARIHR